MSSLPPPASPAPHCVIVMGVSGCGKSTVGRQLAERLGWPYLEGDDFHPPENVARMAAGIALTDGDRAGWLQTLADAVCAARKAGHRVVLSCSALKRSYRDQLRRADPALRIVHLQGEHRLLAQRVAARAHPYMPASLLDSQLLALEPPGQDEDALTLDVAQAPDALVATAVAWLGVSRDAENPAICLRSAS